MSEDRPGAGGPATEPATPTPSRASNVLAIIGWITAVLLPLPVGLVIGGILASQDDKRGRWILGVAGAISLIWIVAFLVLQSAAEDQAARSYYYE